MNVVFYAVRRNVIRRTIGAREREREREREEATKREPSAWGYNWGTLLLGDISTRT
jgi:hypothetical protein